MERAARARQMFARTGDRSRWPCDQLCARIDAEVAALEADARAMKKRGKAEFTHTFVGRVAAADSVMFNALHFDHHREQLPT